MWEALKILGFVESYKYVLTASDRIVDSLTCISMMSTIMDPNDNDMWLEVIGKFFGGKSFEKEDWDQLLGHCQASFFT